MRLLLLLEEMRGGGYGEQAGESPSPGSHPISVRTQQDLVQGAPVVMGSLVQEGVTVDHPPESWSPGAAYLLGALHWAKWRFCG